MTCIENVSPQYHDCLPTCEGLLITSYLKTENLNSMDFMDAKMMKQYNKYKEGIITYPDQLKGET